MCLSVSAKRARFASVLFLECSAFSSFFSGIFSPFLTPSSRCKAPLCFTAPAIQFFLGIRSLRFGFSQCRRQRLLQRLNRGLSHDGFDLGLKPRLCEVGLCVAAFAQAGLEPEIKAIMG